LRSWRHAADRRHRSHFRIRLRARLRHSGQRQSAHADLSLLVCAHAIDRGDFPDVLQPEAPTFAGRSMLVRKTEPLTIECVARGYLSGSGWKDYRATGEVCGHKLPA